jgi:uncharacterized protein YjbJ (UPF0337 family)
VSRTAGRRSCLAGSHSKCAKDTEGSECEGGSAAHLVPCLSFEFSKVPRIWRVPTRSIPPLTGYEIAGGEDNGRQHAPGLEGKWDQVRGRVKESWGVLTDDELDRTEGKWDRLVGLIKEKTGESTSDVERRIREMMG